MPGLFYFLELKIVCNALKCISPLHQRRTWGDVLTCSFCVFDTLPLGSERIDADSGYLMNTNQQSSWSTALIRSFVSSKASILLFFRASDRFFQLSFSLPLSHSHPSLRAAPVPLLLVRQMFRPFSLSNWPQTESTLRSGCWFFSLQPHHPRVLSAGSTRLSRNNGTRANF